MRRTNLKRDVINRAILPKLAVAATLLAACFPASTLAQQKGQKTYATAEAASQALDSAAQANDESAMLQVLGPQGKDIITSGDPAQDTQNRANFAQKFKEMHRLVTEPDGTTTLYLGAENWPTPIPLIKKDNVWYFDTAAGKREILYRRVGQNELSAIRVCQELVAAEKDYFSKDDSEYAAKLVSDPGKHNGLYWPDAAKPSESPVGPLVADASGDAAHDTSLPTGPVPFRGYYFRILVRQGKHAPGGAMDYVVDGKMTKGFAFVAFPAMYRDSGVMTFIVNQDGIVYERDLGKQTDERAKAIKEYDPDSSWKKSEEPEQSAANQKTE
ncbi:MAG: DUF2950 domain-containing protein [Candidatus Acidiferrales bacterium]